MSYLKEKKRLAYSLLLPTVIMVLSIVLLPLFANFWISFKPISLSDLRPPKLILKEKVRGKLTENKNTSEIHYRYRNSSPKYSLNKVTFYDLIPKGIKVIEIKSKKNCFVNSNKIICNLGQLKTKVFWKNCC